MTSEKTAHYLSLAEEVFALDEQGKSENAAARAREIAYQAENSGDQGFAYFFAGEAYCLSGDLKKGAKLEKLAVDELPDVAFVHGNYAVLLSMTGKVRKALHHLNITLELEPDNLQAIAQKGVCLAKLSEFGEALGCFDRVLELSPENLHALRNKAVCLSNLDQPSAALELFEHVLTINPNDAHAKSEKSILLAELEMRRTPLGWLAYKIRKIIIPLLLAIKRRFF